MSGWEVQTLSLLAQAGDGAAPSTSPWISFVPFILIFVIFYFLLIRPQQQRQKKHQALIEALKSGDKVVTNGGIVGTITKVQDDKLKIKVAPSVELEVLRSHVAGTVGDAEARS